MNPTIFVAEKGLRGERAHYVKHKTAQRIKLLGIESGPGHEKALSCPATGRELQQRWYKKKRKHAIMTWALLE